MEIAPRAWLFLTLSGLATGASWVCYFRALKLGEASRVAPVDKFSLVLVAVSKYLTKMAGDGVRVRAGEATVEVDAVLVAMGRRPNLDDLGLETLGLALDERGLPPFDPTTLQVADLPILRIVGGKHFVSDLTLPHGRVLFDYIKDAAG